ncbi:MAG TPA: glycosyltransferase family 87 protein [Candidatus Methylomirabilis sp.]|nr:glycosyltransferase family 87 protein [Candidatus Methylomirabilis sp.]
MLLRSLGRRQLTALGLLAVAVFVYSTIRGATWTSDFKNPYRVARVFWETGTLDVRSEPRYPPTIRVLLAPLAALPIAVAAGIWAFLSLAAMAALPDAIERLSHISLRNQALPWLAVLTFVLDAFALGQSDPINLFLVTAGLVLARTSRPISGAWLIGLAGMIKVLPVIFWSVLMARRRVAAVVVGALSTLVAGLALLTVFAGWGPGLGSVVEWAGILHEREGPWGLVATRDSSLRENNEALPVVLARTFGDLDPGLTRNAVSLARLPLRAIWAIWLAILAAMVLAWLGCALGARRSPPDRAWLGMFALTAVVMLMATPIAWPHYFMWLLPATLFLNRRSRLLLVVAALGQLGMMIPVLRGLGVHTVIALFLFAMVVRDFIAETDSA